MRIYSLIASMLVAFWIPSQTIADDLSEVQILAKKSKMRVGALVTLTRTNGSNRYGRAVRGKWALSPVEPCDNGMVLNAKSLEPNYKNAKKSVECRGSVEIVFLEPRKILVSSLEIDNLRQNISYAVAADDTALVAMLYNELAAQVSNADSGLSRDFAERAVFAWADATNFEGDPVAPAGGNNLTKQFAEHVKQQLIGLESTGRLDFLAFAKTANRDVYWFLYDVHPNPAEVPTRRQGIECARPASSVVNDENLPTHVTALVEAAEKSEIAEEYGNAALLFNEAHARVGDDTVVAEYIEPRVYENAGRALNVSDPIRCDPIQKRFVMTPTMFEAVKAYQGEQATGILDYKTIRGLADIDVGPFLAR